MQININDKTYPLNFSLAAITNFCNERKIEYEDFFNIINDIITKDFCREVSINFADIIIHGIKNGLRKEKRLPDFDVEKDDIIDSFLENKKQTGEILLHLLNSLPEQEEKNGNENFQMPKAKS